jgi:hypothetical protein
MITAAVLVLTVMSVVVVRFVRTYETPASAGRTPAAATPTATPAPGVGVPGSEPSGPPAGNPGIAGGDDPAQQARFEYAAQLIHTTPGHLGIVVRDRRTGLDWRNGETDRPARASSTIKLAMAANLLERGRSGEIKLDSKARKDIADMLDTPSDTAANALWDRFGKEAFVPWFQQQYGMTNLAFPPGLPHNWDQLTGTPDDLIHLMSYVLDRADPGDRDYFVSELRRPGAAQHWGIWAAGPSNLPGNTNGWALETDDNVKHWVTHSVGFAGPDSRYAIAIMYDQAPGGTVTTGVHTVSDIVATIFGAPTPAKITEPPT